MAAEVPTVQAAAPFDRAAVLRALGYRVGRTRPSPAALAEVEAGMREAADLLQPLLLYGDAALECAGPEATLHVPALGLRWRSAALTGVLAGAERVMLYCGTVGERISAGARAALQRGEYTRGVVLDACGSAAVAGLAERARRQAEAWAAARGFRTSAPYSPGYGDWDLADQEPLLRALEARRIGIRTSDTHYLLPEKSFCGIVGWTRGRVEQPQASGCAICFLPGCRYRRTSPLGPPGTLLPAASRSDPRKPRS